MLKFCKLILTASLLSFCSISLVSAQYCYPKANYKPELNGYNFYIDRVRVGDIDNQDSYTPGDTCYSDYTETGPKSLLTRGLTYTMTLNAGPTVYFNSMYYAAWIDYNKDGDFADAGEKLGQFKTTIANQEFPITFTVPATANISNTRMRVRCTYSSSAITVDPCVTYNYGEAEDYHVSIGDFQKIATGISNINGGEIALFNYDNDSDYDLLIHDEYIYSSGVDLNFFSNTSGTYTPFDYVFENPDLPDAEADNLYFTLCDLNNDNAIDFLMTYNVAQTTTPRTIYLQRGATQLSRINTGIPNLMRGSSAAADLNNDGRQDIVICGNGSDNFAYTYVYMNTPTGFVMVNDKLKGITGQILLADYDNDMDVDIFISGNDRYGNTNAIIYRNDNNWKFTNILADLNKVSSNEKSEFGDFNNDGRPDLLIGDKIYRNDGNNNFALIEIEIEPYNWISEGHWKDINNDGIQELVCNDSWGTAFFKYDGTGKFILDHRIFAGGERIAIGDYNNDSKQDILVNAYPDTYILKNITSAANALPSPPAGLTSAVGDSGFFSVALKWGAGIDDKTPVKGLSYNLRIGTTSGGNNIMSSMTSTANASLLRPGTGNVYQNTSWYLKNLKPGIYYWSVQSIDNSGQASAFSAQQQFTILSPLTQTSFLVQGSINAGIVGADFDGDKDIDLIINDSLLTIQEQIATSSYSYHKIRRRSSVLDIKDMNNDNLPDMIIRHNKYFNVELFDSLSIFINKGNFKFSVINLDTLKTYSVAAADFDNDGDIDILAHDRGYYLYKNTGPLQYSRIKLPLTEILYMSSLSAIDIDNDNDIDFIVSGQDNSYNGECFTYIYKNTGNLNFTRSQSIIPGLGPSQFQATSFAGVTLPSDMTWNDYNFDGYPDLIITGDDSYRNNNNVIFLNDRTGKLITSTISPRPADKYNTTWFDFNTDGFLDLVMPKIKFTTDNSIYLNDNNNGYTAFPNAIDSLTSAMYLKAIDIDNDKDKDILCTYKIPVGVDGYRTETKIYRNNNNFVNQAPNPPTSLSHEIDSFTVILNWNKGWDKLTGNDGLTYNIRVGRASNNANIISPMADLATGYRYIENIGNVGTNLTWTLKNLPLGTYNWSVQTIDNSMTGSTWAPVRSFTLSALTARFTNDTVCLGAVTHFTDISVTTSPITSWRWDFGGGNFSTEKNPSFKFTSAGNKAVKLVVTSAVAKDSVTINVPVKNVPDALFTSTVVCAGKPTSFTNTTNLNGLTVDEWHWDFGDGSGANVKDPGTHGYLVPGSYNAILVAVATNACSDTVISSVAIGTIPNAAISSASRTSFCSGDSVVLTNALFPAYNYTWQLDGVDITGANQNTFTAKNRGSYTVTLINPVGNCPDTSAAVIVTVKGKPVKPAIDKGGYKSGDCIGETSIKLSITDPVPGYNYTWYKNEVPYSNSISLEGLLDQANYYVRAELDECIVFSTDTVKVFSKDSPPKPEINAKGPTVWYLMSSITNASKYKWYFNGKAIPDATKSFYIANQKLGKYNLSISNDGVCFTISDTITIPLGVTGIEDPDVFADVKIYPNPTTGMFTIEMDNNIFGELVIDIFLQNGSKILNIKFEKTTEHFSSQIDLSGQSRGMYIINLAINRFKATRKILIE